MLGLAGLFASGAEAAKVNSTERTQIQQPRPVDVPSDEVLEAHGAVIGNSDPGTLEDIGCGMRFGNTRSGLGNVLHIDLAFPLNGDRNISKVQFLVQTKASY
jgi:hypothetical protein